MSSLSDFIDPNTRSKLIWDNTVPGNVYGLPLNEENGITPHSDEIARYKYFIILGKDQNGNLFGGVVINSNINPNQSPSLRLLHYPISYEKYPFLKKNSYVNCVSLIMVKLDLIKNSKLLGQIEDEDLSLIKEAVVTSGVIPIIRLKQFGLI